MYVREHLYFDMQSTRYWRGNNNKKCNINPVQNGIKTHIVAKTKGERETEWIKATVPKLNVIVVPMKNWTWCYLLSGKNPTDKRPGDELREQNGKISHTRMQTIS